MRTFVKKLLKKLNRQDGQVLPMALIVLILTGFIIGPFLSYGSTALITTKVRDGIVEFVDDFGARHAGRGDRVEPRRSVLVDHDAVRHRAQVGTLAADQ